MLATAQTPLSLSDLPFIYSLVNVIIVLYNQHIAVPSYTALLIAGFLGTFVVSTHPLQRMIDLIYEKGKFKNKDFFTVMFTGDSGEIKNFKLLIDDTLLRLSLKTTPIKYEKDKIVASIYFLVVLSLIEYALTTDWLVDELTRIIVGFDIWWIRMTVMIMLGSISILLSYEILNFRKKLRMFAMYFEIIRKSLGGDAGDYSLMKSAIDQNDWDAVNHLLIDGVKHSDHNKHANLTQWINDSM